MVDFSLSGREPDYSTLCSTIPAGRRYLHLHRQLLRVAGAEVRLEFGAFLSSLLGLFVCQGGHFQGAFDWVASRSPVLSCLMDFGASVVVENILAGHVGTLAKAYVISTLQLPGNSLRLQSPKLPQTTWSGRWICSGKWRSQNL
jgi:hypothetical protein